MSSLLDSNVWVALAFDRHEHHALALAWLEGMEEADAASFCRMTQNSFLRLATSVRFFQEEALTNHAALAAYRALRGDPRTGWVEEPAGLEKQWWELADRELPAPKVWMDAYLAAFALQAGMRFVTFDADFARFADDGLDLLELTKNPK